jgi:hypothetical protein
MRAIATSDLAHGMAGYDEEHRCGVANGLADVVRDGDLLGELDAGQIARVLALSRDGLGELATACPERDVGLFLGQELGERGSPSASAEDGCLHERNAIIARAKLGPTRGQSDAWVHFDSFGYGAGYGRRGDRDDLRDGA